MNGFHGLSSENFFFFLNTCPLFNVGESWFFFFFFPVGCSIPVFKAKKLFFSISQKNLFLHSDQKALKYKSCAFEGYNIFCIQQSLINRTYTERNHYFTNSLLAYKHSLYMVIIKWKIYLLLTCTNTICLLTNLFSQTSLLHSKYYSSKGWGRLLIFLVFLVVFLIRKPP